MECLGGLWTLVLGSLCLMCWLPVSSLISGALEGQRGARGADVSQKCWSAPGVRLWGLVGRGPSLWVLILLFLFLYV